MSTSRSQDGASTSGPLRPASHRHRRVPEQDRKRAARACDGCRKQKEKCHGGIPCRRCTRLHRPCEFSIPASTREEPPSSDGPSLAHHPRSGAPQEDVSGLVQRMACMERLLVHYVGNISLDQDTLTQLADSVEKVPPAEPGQGPAPPGISLTPRPRPVSGLTRESAPVIPDADSQSSSSEYPEPDITVQPLENNATHYSGEFSHWNFSMRIKNWIDQCVPQDGEPPSIKEFYRAGEDLQTSSDTAGILSSLPPRYVADFLVRAFFNHTVTNYFYVDRTWLNQKLDLVYRNPSMLSRRDVPTLCIILIIFAIGTQYAYLDSRSSSRRPGEPAPIAEPGSFSEDSVGVMFYQQATRLVADVITIASLESVQACLLIGVYTVPLDASGLSYVYLNLAVRLAIQNGMHRSYPGDGLDPAVRETRNRVWWTAYTYERRIGIFHGRPMCISSSEVDADLPVDEPEGRMGSWLCYTPHQIPTRQLNKVLETVSEQISLFKTNQKQAITDALATLVDIKEKLHIWWDNLPDANHPSSPSQGPISRAALHLRLEYCSVRMFAGRLFITPREPARNNASPSSAGLNESTTSSHRNPSSNAQRRSIMVTDCVEAALSVIETCRLLQRTIGLARASYTEYGSCRAALLVIIAQCLQNPAEALREALREGASMMREMSAVGDSARFDIALIEAFENGVARLGTRSATGGPTASSPEADYEGFKRWEMLWQSEALQQDPRIESGLEAAFGFPPRGMMQQGGEGSTGNWGGGSSRQSFSALAPTGPFFGMDGSLTSMPILDDLSAMFGGGYGHNMDNMGGSATGETTWPGL